MRIVCISDTHSRHDGLQVPKGDVVIHAGDATLYGKEDQVAAFADWFGKLPHQHKLFVAGNHDWLLEKNPERGKQIMKQNGINYLEDSGVQINGKNFWGSPWQPRFMEWAFNLTPNGQELRSAWNKIPTNTDILITHTPPQGQGDCTDNKEKVGCRLLWERVLEIRPKFHIFGHIHEAHGIHITKESCDTTFINASICNRKYVAANNFIVIDWTERGRRVRRVQQP